MTGQAFLEELDNVIKERSMLSHPFYLMWNEGTLTLDMLREYTKQYYHQVHHFPTYVSATHSNCDDMEVRQMLLENLIEEEHGPDNHPVLWLRFAESLGLSRKEVKEAKLLPHTKESVRILKDLARRENPAEGIAALYAYESQIPEVAKTKIKGLADNYNLTSDDATIFFRVHETADEIHSQVTRDALVRMCVTEDQMEAALDAVREAADAINLLLDGVYETYCCEPVTVH